MKKVYEIADGKNSEIILDIAKFRNVLIKVGKNSVVTVLEIGRGVVNQGPSLFQKGTAPDWRVKIIAESGAKIGWYGFGGYKGSLEVDLVGKRASVTVNELVIGATDSTSEYATIINHFAQETQSVFLGFALLQNNAVHNWNVTTMIERKAKKSVASQRINNLLLGENGVVKNRPALIIRNNDVVCSHAVATGHLDEEQLFYFQARGLTLSQSKSLMARGFVEPFLQLLPKSIEQEFGDKLDNLLQDTHV